MKPDLNKSYWDERYKSGDDGWDIGYIPTPLQEYIKQLTDRTRRILIPGCGNGHEAEFLFQKGFKNIYILDWSESALKNFKKRLPAFPRKNLLKEDFFAHKGKYDTIIEHTFFCSIYPESRADYAKKMHELLNTSGKLVGLLFDCEFTGKEPPFGGSRKEYLKYFKPYFDIKVFDTSYNSIKPRAKRELFMILIRKELKKK